MSNWSSCPFYVFKLHMLTCILTDAQSSLSNWNTFTCLVSIKKMHTHNTSIKLGRVLLCISGSVELGRLYEVISFCVNPVVPFTFQQPSCCLKKPISVSAVFQTQRKNEEHCRFFFPPCSS